MGGVQENLSSRIQSQQLAKIYALMQENKDQLGDMSIGDIKSQLNMYKENDF